MVDSDLIDLESLDFSDDQTWLYKLPDDSGQKVDIVDWKLSCDWPEDNEYLKEESELYSLLDEIIKNELSTPDRHKFDSRTFVRPRKRMQRPSIHNMVDVVNAGSNLATIPQNSALFGSGNKYLTYNKYNSNVSPMLRLKTFNVDTNTENSSVVKEFAMKRKSLVQDDDPQLEDLDATLVSDASGRVSSENLPTKPINIDLSQPAHNIHNTFNKGVTNLLNERGSLNMYQSGESLMRMSPPSLVSSLHMESSGNFNPESLDGRRSIASHRESGIPPMSGRDSLDPMMTSMTLSILDEKDMSTSFLSQTTYQDNENLLDSLPPSLVSSVNSSYVIPNKQRSDSQTDSNIFSSATFTHLEQSERLLSARPRCQMFNSFTKRESSIKNSESYTKSREEGCQIDTTKKEAPSPKASQDMSETITYYSNNKFKRDQDAEKENLDTTFENDDTFYKEMGLMKAIDIGKNSLNVTLNKQELDEIIQAREKLSLARKGLPVEEKVASPIKTIQLPNQTITVPRHIIENAQELLSKRRPINTNGYERNEEVQREPPKRSMTFKKSAPKQNNMDATMVYEEDKNIIDINSATLNLIDSAERTLRTEEWSCQQRTMAGSSESTDTNTFSSSSPPDSGSDHLNTDMRNHQIASTPLTAIKNMSKNDLLNLQNTISPIYNIVDEKHNQMERTYDMNATTNNTATIVKKSLNIVDEKHNQMERTYDMNATTNNTATIVKKSSVKRDILTGKASPDKSKGYSEQRTIPSRCSPTSAASNLVKGTTGIMPPPQNVPKKTGLPTSKLRQYSSHRELNRIPAASCIPSRSSGMSRRGVYSSNPALSPTKPAPATGLIVQPARKESYTLTRVPNDHDHESDKPKPFAAPALVRQGTETLRRERPNSQLVAPKDPPSSRPQPTSQLKSRPTSVPAGMRPPVTYQQMDQRPSSGTESSRSALPRPSRLPAPRRNIRPPSVYSVAPTADIDHY